jgi:DNA-directed RNA polymerase sigma subunit (sigma70/sigma32)
MGLTAEEFREKVRLAQAGDTDALREAAHDQLHLAWFACDKYSAIWTAILTEPEAKSEAQLALFKSIKTYKIDSGFKFSTWACYCIRVAFLDLVRKENRRSDRFVCFPYELADEDADEVPHLAEASINLRKLQVVLFSWKADPKLKRYATILELYFGFDPRGPIGYHEIGPIIGLTRERTRLLADRAYGWLCDEFGVPRRTSLDKARRMHC